MHSLCPGPGIDAGPSGWSSPGSVVGVAEGQENAADRPVEPAPAPHAGGPLSSSGAAPADDKPAEKAEEKAGEKAEQKAADKAEQKPADKAEEKPAEKAEEKPVEKAAEKPAEKADEKKAEEKPVEKADEPKAEEKKADEPKADIDLDQPVVVTVGSSGRRVTRVLRHANPVRAARTAGRTTRAWAKRPAGRLLIPAIIAVLLIGGATAAGAYLVPKALKSAAAPSARPPGFPLDAAPPPASAPGASVGAPSDPVLGGSAPADPAIVGERPADAPGSASRWWPCRRTGTPSWSPPGPHRTAT
jgi:hypothetical protein